MAPRYLLGRCADHVKDDSVSCAGLEVGTRLARLIRLAARGAQRIGVVGISHAKRNDVACGIIDQINKARLESPQILTQEPIEIVILKRRRAQETLIRVDQHRVKLPEVVRLEQINGMELVSLIQQ